MRLRDEPPEPLLASLLEEAGLKVSATGNALLLGDYARISLSHSEALSTIKHAFRDALDVPEGTLPLVAASVLEGTEHRKQYLVSHNFKDPGSVYDLDSWQVEYARHLIRAFLAVELLAGRDVGELFQKIRLLPNQPNGHGQEPTLLRTMWAH